MEGGNVTKAERARSKGPDTMRSNPLELQFFETLKFELRKVTDFYISKLRNLERIAGPVSSCGATLLVAVCLSVCLSLCAPFSLGLSLTSTDADAAPFSSP